jgi:hypothetical protein
VQTEVLDAHREADLRIYAVWFAMFEGDAREKWPAHVLTDPRIVHFWDEQKLVGRTFGHHASQMDAQLAPDSNSRSGPVLWDAYLLYDPEARWTEALPSHLVRWGRTIYAARQTLASEAAANFPTRQPAGR